MTSLSMSTTTTMVNTTTTENNNLSTAWCNTQTHSAYSSVVESPTSDRHMPQSVISSATVMPSRHSPDCSKHLQQKTTQTRRRGNNKCKVFRHVHYWKINILHVPFISQNFMTLVHLECVQITGTEYYYYCCCCCCCCCCCYYYYKGTKIV